MERLNLTINQGSIDASTTEFAEKKFKKIIKLLPPSGKVDLIFHIEGKQCRVDAHATAPGKNFHAQSTDLDFFTCLKSVAEKILRQITES